MILQEAKIEEDWECSKVCLIEADKAHLIWPDIEHQIDQALNYAFDGMKPSDVLKRVVQHEIVLAVITYDGEIIASATFQIAENARDRWLHCMTIAGNDMGIWIDQFMQVFREIAKANGCNKITIKGREGWARYARQHGFKHYYTQMYSEV